MIVVKNKHIPAFSKVKIDKSSLLIAETDTGDLAYYTTKLKGKKRARDYESDSDDSDDDDDFDIDDDDAGLFKFAYSKPVESLTRAQWRPHFNDRMTVFIAGAPGAGKSYLAKELINLLPPNIPILLFTALQESDGNFKELGEQRLVKIKMTTENLSKINLAEIRKRSGTDQALLLFDDVDKIRDPKVQNATFAIMNDALANGRGHEKHDGKGDIHVICTSHALNDYIKTKYAFENSNYVAMFPGSTPPLQMYRMFDKLGLDKEICKKLIKLARLQKIRSVIVHKTVPMYLIFGDKIMLI